MAGIVAYGAYIPKLRLERKQIAESWGTPGAPGEIAVGNFDEDSITMAVEAGRDCLLDEPDGVGGLYFASTSAPYAEKSCSTIVASVLDLQPDALVADFGTTLSAGANALVAAVAAVDDGLAESVLVTCAECRVPEPKTSDEQTLGDGAGALLVGKKDVIADIKGLHTAYDEILGSWRTAEEKRIHDFNPRFYAAKGYIPAMVASIKSSLEKFGVGESEISKFIYGAPDLRSHGQVAKSIGVKDPSRIQDPLFAFVGGLGSAQPLAMLAAALEDASPGETFLLVGWGDAYNVMLLEVTDGIKSLKPRRGVKGHVESKQGLGSYAKYLRLKELLEVDVDAGSSSPIQTWRDRKAIYPLYGKKCNKCGEVYFPPRRVCPYCKNYGDNLDWRLKRKGKLWNFIHDYLYQSEESPTTLTITDLEGGGRIFLQMTDRIVDEVEVGMDVELTFRKINEAGHFYNYYWKTRPVR
ncbi:MAG: zinc ribbon domain-containing protein [Actinomycetota bacterium]|nr:zinc ribbon domain-containing protein [Actinomycetota bacterium]